MRDKYGVAQDTYCYPNSATLINLLNIKKQPLLEEAEAEFSTYRAKTYQPQFSNFDLPHLQNIHYHLFQDIYEWAGKLRCVDISKQNTRFCHTDRIKPEADKLFQSLQDNNFLLKLPYQTFIEEVSDYFCELNIIHPFREGNGRTQRLFFEEIIINAGYEVKWSKLTQHEWLQANIAGYHGDTSPLVKLFSQITIKL